MKSFGLFCLSVLFFFNLSSCKVSNNAMSADVCAKDDLDCQSGFKKNDAANIVGKWVSANSITQNPMTYYQTMLIENLKIRLTQICSRQDGVSVTASILLDARILEEGLDLGVGGEREEYKNGITCRVEIRGGIWAYKLSSNVLELNSRSDNQRFKFVRVTN